MEARFLKLVVNFVTLLFNSDCCCKLVGVPLTCSGVCVCVFAVIRVHGDALYMILTLTCANVWSQQQHGRLPDCLLHTVGRRDGDGEGRGETTIMGAEEGSNANESGLQTARPKITVREVEELEHSTQPTFEVQYGESGGVEAFRKNPLVLFGAFGTAAVLVGGLMAFRSGNSRLSQRLMRMRVVAQGATLTVLGASVASQTNHTTSS